MHIAQLLSISHHRPTPPIIMDVQMPPFETTPLSPGVALGTVLPYSGNIDEASRKRLAAAGWLVCDGSAVPRMTYPGLYTAIGYTYGSSGPELFHLPDHRGRQVQDVSDAGNSGPDANGLNPPTRNDETRPRNTQTLWLIFAG